MKSLFLALTLLLTASLGAPAGNEGLVGTRKLVRFTRTIVATGETLESFGKTASGYIQFGRDDRMMVLIVKDDRPNAADPEKITEQQRAELFRTMISYAGPYKFDGKKLTSRLHVS